MCVHTNNSVMQRYQYNIRKWLGKKRNRDHHTTFFKTSRLEKWNPSRVPEFDSQHPQQADSQHRQLQL